MVYLDKNGVTIKADKKAKVGQEYILNGVSYLVVDDRLLLDMIHDNKNVTKVVTTRIKNMTHFFKPMYNNYDFNQDISSWDVSNVTTMRGMFSGNKTFNQDISKWDVSRVKNMSEMFFGATRFNSNLSEWNTANVRYMISMFEGASLFNQDISSWNVEGVWSMERMFCNAISFNSELNDWNIKGVENLKNMFCRAKSFNQDLSKWDTKRAHRMTEMFMEAEVFNQDISMWKFEWIQNMDRMFKGAKVFNQDLSKWKKCKSLKKPVGMFIDALAFNKEYAPFDIKVVSKRKQSVKTSKGPKTKKEYKQQIVNNLLKGIAELEIENLINNDPELKKIAERWDESNELNKKAYENYESGNYLEGIELAQTAYSLNEKSYILDTLAEGYFLLKQYETALEYSNKAILLDKQNESEDHEHFLMRAKIHLALNNAALAKKDFEKVLEIDSNHEEAIKYLNQINK